MPDPNAPALTGGLNQAVTAAADAPKAEQADPETGAATDAADKAETALAGLGEAAGAEIVEHAPAAVDAVISEAEAFWTLLAGKLNNLKAHVPHAANGDLRAAGAAIGGIVDLLETMLSHAKPAA